MQQDGSACRQPVCVGVRRSTPDAGRFTGNSWIAVRVQNCQRTFSFDAKAARPRFWLWFLARFGSGLGSGLGLGVGVRLGLRAHLDPNKTTLKTCVLLLDQVGVVLVADPTAVLFNIPGSKTRATKSPRVVSLKYIMRCMSVSADRLD